MGETRRDFSKETVELITQAKDQLGTDLTRLQKEYRQFRSQTPLVWVGGDKAGLSNPHEARLAQIESIRSSAVLENTQLQAKIEGIEAALQRGADREAVNLMMGHVADAIGPAGRPASIDDQLFPMMLEEQGLLAKYGPDHPQVKMLRMRMEFMRQHLLGVVAQNADKNEAKPTDFYQVYLESLREQIKLGEQKIKTFTELYEKERDSAKALVDSQTKDEAFRAEIDRKERLFDVIIRRLEEINLVKEVSDPGIVKAEVLQAPSSARQIEPDMKSILTRYLLIGGLLGLGLAFVLDTADRRFRSPEDIQHFVGLPVITHVPQISKSQLTRSSDRRRPPARCQTGGPSHAAAQTSEAYRAVRTALYFAAQASGHKVFQVTSSDAGDGKTTLAANLAISIAQSGKRVVLLEADFRRPRLQQLFDLQDSKGLSGALADSEEVLDVFNVTPVENLSVITCGPRPANPADLLTSPRFEQLLEVLREKFDFVLVDSPPLLAVTDPAIVAPLVDGVLLVLRLTKHARSGIRRSRAILDSLGTR